MKKVLLCILTILTLIPALILPVMGAEEWQNDQNRKQEVYKLRTSDLDIHSDICFDIAFTARPPRYTTEASQDTEGELSATVIIIDLYNPNTGRTETLFFWAGKITFTIFKNASNETVYNIYSQDTNTGSLFKLQIFTKPDSTTTAQGYSEFYLKYPTNIYPARGTTSGYTTIARTDTRKIKNLKISVTDSEWVNDTETHRVGNYGSYEINSRYWMNLGAVTVTYPVPGGWYEQRGEQTGYTEGYLEGKDIGREEGYAAGYQEGETNTLNGEHVAGNLVLAIITAPVELINRTLDFDIFGFNVATLVKALITLCFVAFVIFIIVKVVMK